MPKEWLIFDTDTSPFERVTVDGPHYLIILMRLENYYIMRHLIDSFNMNVGCLYKGHIYDVISVFVEKATEYPTTYVYVHWHLNHVERLIFTARYIDKVNNHPLTGVVHSGTTPMSMEAVIEISQIPDEWDARSIYYILKKIRDSGDWIMYEDEVNVFYNEIGDKRVRDDLEVIDFN